MDKKQQLEFDQQSLYRWQRSIWNTDYKNNELLPHTHKNNVKLSGNTKS